MLDRILRFSVKLLLACAAVFCLCQSAAAQSGRRQNKNIETSKSPINGEPAKTDAPKPDASAAKNSEKITSIIIVGADYQKNSILYYSTDINTALKELTQTLKDRTKQAGINVTITRGEKMGFEDAQKLAKKQTDAHILWIGLKTASDAYRNSWVEFIDYAVLAPQTSKRLTTGRIEPGQQVIVGQGGGGVLRMPTTQKRRSSFSEIISATREITERLIRWGWLE